MQSTSECGSGEGTLGKGLSGALSEGFDVARPRRRLVAVLGEVRPLARDFEVPVEEQCIQHVRGNGNVRNRKALLPVPKEPFGLGEEFVEDENSLRFPRQPRAHNLAALILHEADRVKRGVRPHHPLASLGALLGRVQAAVLVSNEHQDRPALEEPDAPRVAARGDGPEGVRVGRVLRPVDGVGVNSLVRRADLLEVPRHQRRPRALVAEELERRV
mmetsp:Transcript_8492/g.21070  ORF Transcript_8492/g.21070 Transcript_8492/m.21070 type:complete len:216 (-) Transcript_8492:257-904(-)